MKKLLSIAAVMSAALFVSGCDDDDDTPQTNLQAVHASADAPRADVLINGTPQLEGVDYAQASGYLSVNAGSTSLQVDVELPGVDVATVIPSTSFDLSSDTDYTVMVVGDASGANNPVEALVVTRPAAGTADGASLDVQVVHAASGVGMVNVHVTEPGATLSSGTVLATLDYKDFTGVVNVPAGDYQVRLEVVQGGVIAFDSGTVSLGANSELTIAAIGTADSSSVSPVKLLVMDGSGSSIINDIGEKAEIRIGHLVSDAPTVDVDATGASTQSLTGVNFKDVTGFLDFTPGAYNLSIVDNATRSSSIINADTSVGAGLDFSIYAVGQVALGNVEPLIVQENRRSVATSAVLNVTHAAANPIASSVDIYLTENASIAGSDPAISGFAYKDSVTGVYVPGGNYFVTVTVAGDPNTIAINAAPITLTDGVVTQVVAIDDGAGFNAIVDPITD